MKPNPEIASRIFCVNLLILCFVFMFTGCAEENWSEQDQNEFVEACEEEGGKKSYCKCFMKNAMDRFPISDDADNMSFEEAVELSKDCK